MLNQTINCALQIYNMQVNSLKTENRWRIFKTTRLVYLLYIQYSVKLSQSSQSKASIIRRT